MYHFLLTGRADGPQRIWVSFQFCYCYVFFFIIFQKLHSTLYAHKYTCINRSYTWWCIKKVITLPFNWLYRENFFFERKISMQIILVFQCTDFIPLPMTSSKPRGNAAPPIQLCNHSNYSKGKSDDLVSFFLPTKEKTLKFLNYWEMSLLWESQISSTQESWPCPHSCWSLKIGFDSLHYRPIILQKRKASVCLITF